MSRTISVKEYGYLYEGEGGQLGTAAYEYLRQVAIQPEHDTKEFLSLTTHAGRECLQVKNYVGVLSTPDGSIIEVLPKHSESDASIESSRALLWKMLRVVHEIPWQASTDAQLQTHKKPLHELLIGRFLQSVGHLVHRGIRSDYLRVHDTRRFLKGRLTVARQLRLPSGRATDFCIEFDEYSIDRPENRLIRLALDRVSSWRLGVNNTRTAKELSIAFADVSPSSDIRGDFSKWRKQRDMAHYQAVKPWLELILHNLSPWLFSGGWSGISMLFPMEQLFESYVEKVLRRQLRAGFSLKGQAASAYLTRHKGKRMFQLKPDMLIREGTANYCVMDAKWKLLDQSAGDGFSKYNLKQADLYQLFAYGHKYLGGRGELLLVYPRYERFTQPLEPFLFEDDMRLWIVPFDLEADELLLPEGIDLSCFARKSVTEAA